MARLTEYDEIRGIYKLKVDCNQGENIQKLGRLEDRDEAKITINSDFGFDNSKCGSCGYTLIPIFCETEEPYTYYFDFCPKCGQRLKWGNKIWI